MTQDTVTPAQPRLVNGVDIAALSGTIDAIKENPDLARFEFRARTSWLGGDQSRTTIGAFHGACQEHRAETAPFEVGSAEPPVLLGTDSEPNPVEYLLHALSTCVTTTLAYHAAARGIVVGAIDSEIEGDLDLHGFLGLNDKIRKGYQTIRLKMRVESSEPAERLAELARFSPVFDVVSKSVPVELDVETA